MNISSMTRNALRAEIKRLSEVENISASDDQRLNALLAEWESRENDRKRVSATATRSPGWDAPTYWKQTSLREVFDSHAQSPSEAVSLAARAIDHIETEGGREVRSDVKKVAASNPGFAEQFRAAADPNYTSAFVKLVATGDAGRAMLAMSDDERAAMQRVAGFDQRAAATSPDSAGGYLIPELLSPDIVVNNDGVVSRIRDVARIVSGVSDKWTGINSAGITASWDGEGVEVSDDTPVLASNEITAHKAAAFVPFSLEIEADWEGMVEQMRRLLADAKDNLEGDAFINGSGSGQPYGLLTRLEASTTVQVSVTTSGTFSAVDVYNVLAQLPPRYRSNARFAMSLDVMNEVRALGDDKLGNQTVDLSAGYGFNLLGRPVIEDSSMPDMPSGTNAGTLLTVGSFDQFVIFDRLGSGRVELVPHLFGTTNGRPTGQRGVYFHWRVGADLVSGAASTEPGFRILRNT